MGSPTGALPAPTGTPTATEVIFPSLGGRGPNAFLGWWLRIPYLGDFAHRRVTAYDTATGQLTIDTLGGTIPTVADMELWRPHGDGPTSLQVEHAIERARQRLRYETVTTLTMVADQTLYALPSVTGARDVTDIRMFNEQGKRRGRAVRVEFNPGASGWEVELYPRVNGGAYPADWTAKVTYTRVPDSFVASPAAVWSVDEDWAVAEGADVLLSEMAVAASLRDRANVVNTRLALQDDLEILRRQYMPQKRVMVTW